ncbi:MAG: hypothetical protein KDE48_19725 [Anaerolineales bacterium]|nr:hypothetical protein [Anaerolineales bacterium]
MKKRPFGVTLLAILAAFAALLAFWHALQLMGWAPFSIGDIQFFRPSANILGALMWVLLAAIYIWLVRRLWNVDPQGWMFLVLISILNLIMAGISIIGNSSFQAMLPSIVFNGLILIYCLLPGTKDAFGTA